MFYVRYTHLTGECSMNTRILRQVIILSLMTLMINYGTVHAQSDWSAWKYRMPIKLTNRNPETAGLVPVDVTFSVLSEQCRKPEHEIRLILKTDTGEQEVPFQLSRVQPWTQDIDWEHSKATLNGMITFFDVAQGDSDAEYFLLYGNTSAEPPSYPTDLTVSGTGPSWTIENDRMLVKLHASGQIASVTLKDKSDAPIAPDTGIMHWNPGVYIPTRYWAHAFDWNPPDNYSIESGPLFVEIRRSGVFPDFPEVYLSITYRIFTGRSYVESGTVMRLRDDVGVVALRNDELVFDAGFFTHVGWDNGDGTVKVRQFSQLTPVNRHGDVLRLSDTIPFVTMYNPASGVGAASLRIDYANIGPRGDQPVLFDNATYISSGGGELQYWFRPLVYFHVDWDRKQLISVPQGSVYSERNFYYFYETGAENPVQSVIDLSNAVRLRPGIQIGEYRLPPGE